MVTNIRVTDLRYDGKAKTVGKPGPKPATTLTVAQHQAIQYMTLGDANGRKMTDIEIAEACGSTATRSTNVAVSRYLSGRTRTR